MFGKRLKKLREQAGLFQEAVAEAVGTSSRNIGYYENMDRRPNPEMLIKLANFYNVSVDYLLGRSDNPHDSFVSSNIKNNTTVVIKILGNIRAGRPLFANEHIKGELSLPQKLLTSEYEHFILEVVGDSMTGAGIKEGDFVLVRVQNFLDHDGQIAAVIVDDNEACLKHAYVSDDKKHMVLRSANPEYHDIVRPVQSVHINGVITGFFQRTL